MFRAFAAELKRRERVAEQRALAAERRRLQMLREGVRAAKLWFKEMIAVADGLKKIREADKKLEDELKEKANWNQQARKKVAPRPRKAPTLPTTPVRPQRWAQKTLEGDSDSDWEGTALAHDVLAILSPQKRPRTRAVAKVSPLDFSVAAPAPTVEDGRRYPTRRRL